MTIMDDARWWLVDHPVISGYEWRPNESPGASMSFVAGAVTCYLTTTLVLRQGLIPLPQSGGWLRGLSTLHNLIILLISALMAVGCTVSTLAQAPDRQWIFCFPRGTQAQGPVFFWAHVFYFSKIYEFVDTLLILLGGGSRLTFLHVYHHAAVAVMCYLWLSESQSLVPVALVTNASVHVVMYSYYLSASVGLPWSRPWKRLVTRLQIVQFVFSFAASVVFLWRHYAGPGCSGMGAWVFNAVFNASLLFLFMDFHRTAYGRKKGGKME